MKKTALLLLGISLLCNASEETASSSSATTAHSSPSTSVHAGNNLDAIDRAIALSCKKEDVSGETILAHLDDLRQLEETYKQELKLARQKRESPSERTVVSLRALEAAAGELRINWADRILKKATAENIKKNSALKVEADTCLEELDIHITSQVLKVNEPFESATKTQLRIDELIQESNARGQTKKQLELEQAVWKEVLQRNKSHMLKEKALYELETHTGVPLSSPGDTRSLLGEQQNRYSSYAQKAKEALEQKRKIFACMQGLIAQCKAIDAQFLQESVIETASDDDDDVEESEQERMLRSTYDNFSATVKALVEQVPFMDTTPYCETMQDTQARYLQLVLIEKLAAQATENALSSLLAVNSESEKNRARATAQMLDRKQIYSGTYEHMKKDLEAVKLRQTRLKVLLGKELNMFEKERLSKDEAEKRISQSIEAQ